MSDEFAGFKPPVKNYFPMPNEWIDICADIKSLAEMKVVQYIIRHTWGYKEYDGTPKTITTDEFMHGRKRADGSRIDKGTGLSNRSVIDGLRDAEKHGYLVKDVDDADKARINKSYALKMVEAIPDVKMLHTSDVNNLHTGIRYEETSQPVCNPFTSTVKNVHSDYEETSQRSEKYTLERHLEKDTLEKQESAHAFSENEYHFVEGNKHRAWNCLDWCNKHNGTCVDYQAAIDNGLHDEDTAKQTAIKIGATDGHPTPDHPAADHRAADSVRPDEPSEQTPLPIARVAQLAPPGTHEGHEQQDGAATEIGSGPRASGKQLPLSLKESEPTVRPETPAQRKRRIEAREKEIWALVEAGLRTKFTKTHRQLKANTTGMERLIEDETNDETLKEGLEKLSDFWKNQFDLAMFHAKLPGLVREQAPQQTRKLADKSPQSVRDVQYEAALQKIGQPLEQEEVPAWLDFDNYVGNGPEERQRLVERGRELKAQGFCPDL